MKHLQIAVQLVVKANMKLNYCPKSISHCVNYMTQEEISKPRERHMNYPITANKLTNNGIQTSFSRFFFSITLSKLVFLEIIALIIGKPCYTTNSVKKFCEQSLMSRHKHTYIIGHYSQDYNLVFHIIFVVCVLHARDVKLAKSLIFLFTENAAQ